MYAMEFHTIFFYNCLITKIQNDQIKYFGQTILAFLVLEILNNVCYAIISHHDVTLFLTMTSLCVMTFDIHMLTNMNQLSVRVTQVFSDSPLTS
jgi:hypothetical protein